MRRLADREFEQALNELYSARDLYEWLETAWELEKQYEDRGDLLASIFESEKAFPHMGGPTALPNNLWKEVERLAPRGKVPDNWDSQYILFANAAGSVYDWFNSFQIIPVPARLLDQWNAPRTARLLRNRYTRRRAAFIGREEGQEKVDKAHDYLMKVQSLIASNYDLRYQYDEALQHIYEAGKILRGKKFRA